MWFTEQSGHMALLRDGHGVTGHRESVCALNKCIFFYTQSIISYHTIVNCVS